MLAMVYTQYGTPDVLALKEVEKPIPQDDEVLVKVRAASINSWDWDLLRGKPVVFRFWGLFKPKFQIPGADVAGQVERVGEKVKQFKPGDEVFGDLCNSWGGFAEYVCARENALAIKPAAMTFAEAAALPQAGVLAVQGLRDNGQIQKGQKLLINGAGGGVGTFALQMAKSSGAEVTAVDSTEKLAMLRELGADQVMDYTQEDFTKHTQRYDMILDVVGHRSIFDFKRILNPRGIYVMVGGTPRRLFQVLILGLWISKTSSKKMGVLVHKPNQDLAYLKELFEDGKVIPVIDKRYPLSETADAFSYFGKGRVQGKIVITM